VVRGRDLDLELLDPGSEPLVRLYRHAEGDWEPPPEQHRNLRVDPPRGRQGAYAVLYTANTLPAAAAEGRVLNVDGMDRYTWARDRARHYWVVRYAFDLPALFIPIDGTNRGHLGLAGGQRRFAGYEPYQVAAMQLFERYGQVVHGLSWESFHRNQPGRVYALWHHHKATIALRRISTSPHSLLVDDEEWLRFLREYPDIEAIES